MKIRSAPHAGALASARWSGPAGSGSAFEAPDSRIELPREHRWMQYKVLFVTPDAGSTPVLEEVMIE
jgi:hypothetical protein